MTIRDRGHGASLSARYTTLPLLGLATVIGCAIWCVVYASYVGHILGGQARETSVDITVLAFALVSKLDKIGAPLAQIIFSHWFANGARVEVIAGGMLCGTPFGVAYGLYLIAWSFEQACRNSPYGTPLHVNLRWLRMVYFGVIGFLIASGLWHALKLASFLPDLETLGVALAAGLLSGLGVFCTYAVLGWLSYWATIAGHGLWRSMRKFG